MGIMRKIFGTRSQREVKRLQPLVDQIEALEPTCRKLSDGELAAKTKEFQERYQKGETLDALLPEAFAVCREAAEKGADLIVTHHPLIFHPRKAVTDGDDVGRSILFLAQPGLPANNAHINLD